MFIFFIPAGPDTRFHAHEEFGDRRDKVVSARTYFYKDEAHCDENMDNFLKGIDAVSGDLKHLFAIYLSLSLVLRAACGAGVWGSNPGETFSEWLLFSHPPGMNENRKTVFIHPGVFENSFSVFSPPPPPIDFSCAPLSYW